MIDRCSSGISLIVGGVVAIRSNLKLIFIPLAYNGSSVPDEQQIKHTDK
jgi:hypothetical protein